MDGKKLLLGAGLILTACGTYFYYNVTRAVGATNKKVISVTQLWTYPIKSCSGMALTEATLGAHGFEYDREWVVVRAPGADAEKPAAYDALTQRENQKMKLITATIEQPTAGSRTATPTLVLSSEGVTPFELPIVGEKALAARDVLEIGKWGLVGGFVSEGPEVATWLSIALGESVFLARCVRPRNPNDAKKFSHLIQPSDRVRGHDFSTLHVLSEEGLDWIRKESQNPLVNSSRFRPNIVVSGTQWPEEDSWMDFTVGVAKLRTCKLTSRCAIPTVDSEGKLHKLYEPTATLRRLHSKPSVPDDVSSSQSAMFGLSVFHTKGDDEVVKIALGDNVKVVSVRT